MKNFSRDSFINTGFGVALAILVAIGSLSYLNARAITGFDQMEKRSYMVILELEELRLALTAVESGEHTYTLTGDESSLVPYHAALGEIDRHLSALKVLTKNHPAQIDRVIAVEPLIMKRVVEAQETVKARKEQGFQAALKREVLQQHQVLTQTISDKLVEARDAVATHLNNRAALKEASARKMLHLFLVGYLLCIGLLVSPFLLLRKDISERKRTEGALRLSEERYRALYLDNPTMIATLDSDLTMISVNPICACQLGYRIAELEGQSVLKIFHEDDRQAVTEQFRTCLQNPNQVYRWKFRKIHRDGSLLWVEETAQAVHSPNGALNILVVCQDITDRHQAQEALRRSEEKFSKIFHSVPALVGISTLKEGRFIDINMTALRTLGYRPEEMIGKTAYELGLWEDEAKRAEVIQALRAAGTVRNFETRFKGKDGRVFLGLFSAEIIVIEDDLYMLSLVKDISDLKRMEEEIRGLNASLSLRAAQLEQANRELEAFNYTVAHDLRKPLTVVNAYCQAIRELCLANLSEECVGFLGEAYQGTLRMNRLIDALLNFSNLAHVELHHENIDLSLMARDAAAELRATDPKRRVSFRIAPGITAQGDANLMRLVLDNLLGNAWKYTGMREEGIVEFGTTGKDDRPVYFVRDNGTGFNMADADQLFVPFKRLPGVETFGGFGIGLATVERIVRRHLGRVWAEGEPDKGATFYFTMGSDDG